MEKENQIIKPVNTMKIWLEPSKIVLGILIVLCYFYSVNLRADTIIPVAQTNNSPEKQFGTETTNSSTAYHLFKKSINVEKIEGRSKDALLNRSILLEQAVKEEPNFVEAWAVLKRLYDYMLLRIKTRGWYVKEGMDKDKVIDEYEAKSKFALEKALALDAKHHETLLATVIDYDWNKPVEILQKQKDILELIIAENPSHAKAWYHLGWWYEIISRKPNQDIEKMRLQSKQAFNQALLLDPYNARMIDALLNLSRRKGYHELIGVLTERLKQVKQHKPIT